MHTSIPLASSSKLRSVRHRRGHVEVGRQLPRLRARARRRRCPRLGRARSPTTRPCGPAPAAPSAPDAAASYRPVRPLDAEPPPAPGPAPQPRAGSARTAAASVTRAHRPPVPMCAAAAGAHEATALAVVIHPAPGDRAARRGPPPPRRATAGPVICGAVAYAPRRLTWSCNTRASVQARQKGRAGAAASAARHKPAGRALANAVVSRMRRRPGSRRDSFHCSSALSPAPARPGRPGRRRDGRCHGCCRRSARCR